MVDNAGILHHITAIDLTCSLVIEIMHRNIATKFSFKPFLSLFHLNKVRLLEVPFIVVSFNILRRELSMHFHTINFYCAIFFGVFLDKWLFFTFFKWNALDDLVSHLRKIKWLKLFRLVNTNKNEPRLKHEYKHRQQIKDVNHNLNCQPVVYSSSDMWQSNAFFHLWIIVKDSMFPEIILAVDVDRYRNQPDVYHTTRRF